MNAQSKADEVKNWLNVARTGALGLSVIALIELALRDLRSSSSSYKTAFLLFGLASVLLAFASGIALLRREFGWPSFDDWASLSALYVFITAVNALVIAAHLIFGIIVMFGVIVGTSTFMLLYKEAARRDYERRKHLAYALMEEARELGGWPPEA